MEKEVTIGILTLALGLGCARCDLDQPHIHIENEPFENSVTTLSYTPTSNIAVKDFGFDSNSNVAGFDVGLWT
jgi:hypothetical protein